MAPKTCFPTLPILAALVATACEDKPAAPKAEPSANKDGGLSKMAGVDKNLAEAVMEIAGGQGGNSGGPPPNGVFGKGAADREVPPGAAPTVKLGSAGADPKVTFAPAAWKPGKKRDTTVTVSIITGPQSALPTVDVGFSLEPAAPPAPAAGDAPAATGPLAVTATVSSAKLAADQPGQLPPGLAAEISKLKGCKVKLEILPSGAGRTVGFEAPSSVNEDLAQIPKSAADALALEMLPFPTEAVGVGGFWMVTSREPFVGVDAVAYRMIKVDKIDGDRAGLLVTTKRYVAGGHIGISGLPAHEIQEFSGNGSGQVLVSTKDPFQMHAEETDVLLSNLTPQGGGQPGQRMGLQLQVQTTVQSK